MAETENDGNELQPGPGGPGPSVRQPEASLFHSLRAPQPSDLARSRQVKRNPPVGRKRHQPSKTSHDPKSVSLHQRLREFPNEALSVSAGKLFCTACREELALKVTVIRQHLKSNKHTLGKERLQRKDGQEKDIAEAFAAYNEKEHLAGETLSKDTQVYRIKVVSTFLKAGVPLNKLDTFRELLEENGPRLAGRRSLSDLIPFIREREVAQIRREIAGKKVSAIFDGTTRLGEALVIVLRFVTDDWQI